MIDRLLFSKASFQEAKAALDSGATRQRVLAANIANANTPGYRAQQVRFEELLSDLEPRSPMTRTDPAHLSSQPEPAPLASVEPRNGGATNGINDVEIETEMVELSENAVHYQAIAQLIAGKYRGLMEAIRSQG
jgi:flagellar basal-body rod protein FlgB